MEEDNNTKLAKIAQSLIPIGKGILAADESTSTITKRFELIGVPSTEETRRQYRQLLFTTPEIEKYISGVIMYDETIRQKSDNGESFVSILQNKGIIPGIKVDGGTTPLRVGSSELLTIGLEGLPERLASYYELGARFAKWRAVFTISDEFPTSECIEKNSQALALYAIQSQQAGLVPIVEPEVMMEGSHSQERCYEVTNQVLLQVFKDLEVQKVSYPGMLLKPNMIVPGKSAAMAINPYQTAQKTRALLETVVPKEVPGIVFLSGGMTPVQATENLNAMNKERALWQLSFSYGRALQEPVLKAWNGSRGNESTAQEMFLERARLNSLAVVGKYDSKMETMS